MSEHCPRSRQSKQKYRNATKYELQSQRWIEPALYSCQLAKSDKPFLPIPLAEARSGKATRPVRIYANGVFDVFHIGHMNALKQAKNFFPNVYLMVGVYNDNIAHYKKGFTVLTQSERYESLIHCRYVDEVVTNAPLAVTPEFMEEYHIDFVANDGGKAGHSKDVYKDIKAMGRFIPTESTSGISTSEIIAKVTRNYDIYVRRNLRRGYSRKDLNVGLVKKTHYEIQDAIGELHEMVKNVEDRSQLLLQMVEGRSYEFCKRLADISANFRENWNGKLPESKEGRSKFYELDEGKNMK